MLLLFEIIKVIFFMLTIMVGAIYSGSLGRGEAALMSTREALMPGYLICV
jgi:hypothetical protein